MDGRIQLPIIHWLKEQYGFSFVDTITEPGIDKLFSNIDKVREIKLEILFSVEKHNSKLIVVSGHHDCTENPVSKSIHQTQIKNNIKIIQSWNIPVKIIGIWINEDWEVELVEN